MHRAPLALVLLLLASACSSFSDAEPYDRTLPTADLKSLAGQEVVLDLRTERGAAIVSGRLYGDLREALTANGVKLVETGATVLEARYGDISTKYYRMTWQGCGRLAGQLTRNGNPIGRRFISDYCSEVTANPGEYTWVRRPLRGEIDAYERAYFGLLHAFFNDLEESVG